MFLVKEISLLFNLSFVHDCRTILNKKSLIRTGGARGADADTIRGNTGADFEGNATIYRASIDSIPCLCFSSSALLRKEKSTECLLLIKGPFCFVYNLCDESSPKYAVALQSIKPMVEQETIVVLKSSVEITNSQYEVKFKNNETAAKFAKVVLEQASSAQAQMVRKKLGHTALIQTRSSIAYAETVALRKIDDQPSEPITTQEILSNFPAGATQM
jgi:hypothetical protein